MAHKKTEGKGAERETSQLPDFFVEGIDKVIIRDLELAKANVEKAKIDLRNHNQAKAYHMEKKAHYRQIIKDCKAGLNKYNLQALIDARTRINVDLQATMNHVQNATERIEHHGNIVKTLEKQLAEYDKNWKVMRKHNLLKQS